MAGQTPDMFHQYDSTREQFKLAHIQTYNWGTFSGLADFPIPEEGFLFAGPSGSGKSTVLDGHASLTTPSRWLKFNVAAAREADRNTQDRNLVSYIRGAWAQQTGATGEATAQFLRPDTTWSALVETYRNKAGRVVTLAQLLWIRGKSTANGDVRKLYMILERDFDVRDLDFWPKSDFDVRKLKATLTDAFVREEFSAYQERFRMLLGIESELALRLLHKTQSAKNLGDLNAFLRDFMLDIPETFDIAKRLVDEFGALNAAHLAVVSAREQIGVLSPAYETHERREATLTERSVLEEVRVGLQPYEEQLKARLYDTSIRAAEVTLGGLQAEQGQLTEELAGQDGVLRSLHEECYHQGGGQLEDLKAQLDEVERSKVTCQERKARAEAAASGLGRTLTLFPRDYAELVEDARQQLESGPARLKSLNDAKVEQLTERKDLDEEFGRLVREVRVMESQPSNIPAPMLELRKLIASGAGIEESQLPFAGELLEVKEESREWEGAIERVLRPLALSLLVDEKHYSAVSRYLNSRHIGRRIVYLRMLPHAVPSKSLPTSSLIHKLKVAKCPQAEWLREELRARFDYECADSMDAFQAASRALTREGLVKHGNSRHEKDDRSATGDRSTWVLGFDNTAKRKLFEEKAADVAAHLESINAALRTSETTYGTYQTEQRHCQTLINLPWAEIDLGSLLDRTRALQERIAAITTGNRELADLQEKITGQEFRVKRLRKDASDLQAEVTGLEKEITQLKLQQASLRNELLSFTLSPTQREQLDTRYAAVASSLDLSNLSSAARKVESRLSEDRHGLDQRLLILKNAIETAFAEFNRRWPAESGGLDATLDSAPDYFAKLDRLQKDNLPKYEERFLQLLREQSDQNLTLLSTQLEHERKGILERLVLVNTSLETAPFNPGTHLVLDPLERNLEAVKDFKAALRSALSNSFGSSPEQAEARFAILRDLVDKLSSQETVDQNWRALVLDVRQHVEFRARELDINGEEIEVYLSGAGKSGGQKQKLAATILAAALRYQLGGNDRAAPCYSTVVMDEAFDQADAEFTSIAMNIFKTFGFQMVVATPLKAVMAMEPYIGGAAFVHIKDRKHSSALFIEYDTATRSLKRTPEVLHEIAAAE